MRELLLYCVITHKVSAQGDVRFLCRPREEERCLLLLRVQDYALLFALQETSLGQCPNQAIVQRVMDVFKTILTLRTSELRPKLYACVL